MIAFVIVSELRPFFNLSLTPKNFLGKDCRTRHLRNAAMFQMTHECRRTFSVVVQVKDELGFEYQQWNFKPLRCSMRFCNFSH